MKLKTVSAHSIPEAMTKVRQTLGEEAVIVSSLRLASGDVQLVVAVPQEEENQDDLLKRTLFNRSDDQKNSSQILSKIRSILSLHRVSEHLINRLVQIAADKQQKDIKSILAASFKDAFSFSPIGMIKTKRAFLLTGIAGSGKTTALMKWATTAKIKGLKTALITLDNKRIGAIQELNTFSDVLQIPLSVPKTIEEMPEILHNYRQTADLILIDSPGLNPWLATDMAMLADVGRLCQGVEFVFVMPAGLDAMEAADTALCFERLGCSRLIATRLDVSNVYGNILNVADIAHMTLAHYTDSRMLTESMNEFTPDILSNLMIKNISG